MTHLFDTSAILAHHLQESGADRVQALFEDEDNDLGICVEILDASKRVADARTMQFQVAG